MFLLRAGADPLGHHSYVVNAATRAGDWRQIEMSVTGMYDESGAFVGVLAAFRDITEVIDLQLRLGEVDAVFRELSAVTARCSMYTSR